MLASAFVLLFASRAWAQQAPPTAPPAPVSDEPVEPRLNFLFAYAYMHDSSWDEHLFYGWQTTLSFRMTKNLSIVGEFGGNHGEYLNTGFTIQRYALLGGVKLTGGEGRMRPFFQGLVGVSRQGGDVGLADGYAVQGGGGVDMTLNERWTFRAQADFRWFREDVTWTAYRFSGGVVVYLGKRH